MLSKLGGFVYFFTFWGSWWLSRNGTFLFVFVLSLPLRILAKENVASKATIFQAILTIQNLNKTTQSSLHQNIKGFTTFTLTIGVSERCPVLVFFFITGHCISSFLSPPSVRWASLSFYVYINQSALLGTLLYILAYMSDIRCFHEFFLI